MELWKELSKLLEAGYPVVSLRTPDEPYALDLVKAAVRGQPGEIWQWSAAKGLMPIEGESTAGITATENPAAALSSVTAREGRQIVVTLDLLEHLDDKFALRAVRDFAARLESDRGGLISPGHLIMIDHGGELPPSVADVATTFEVPLPDEAELEGILRRTISRYHREISTLEIDISRNEFRGLVSNLRGLTRGQAERIVMETIATDRKFSASDLATVIEAKRRLIAGRGTLEFVDRPADLDQVGGLRNLKKWLELRSRAFDDAAREFGLRPPRGVLMLGVQGTGKSLCARAIATAWDRPLLRLDAGSLYDSYIGASERRLRDALGQAEAMSPIVLWIDEIEKAFSSASSTSSDGGLSRRMFGALLTWMQEHTEPVFLVATANDIDALPPELLRKGRFDEIFFVDLPVAEVRREILSIHLRKRGLDPASFDLEKLARESDGFSAAELEEAIVSSMHAAFADKSAGGAGRVTTEMVAAAIRDSPPLSVTAAEKVRALQLWAKTRCVPAD